jgi:hypothetical protein
MYICGLENIGDYISQGELSSRSFRVQHDVGQASARITLKHGGKQISGDVLLSILGRNTKPYQEQFRTMMQS